MTCYQEIVCPECGSGIRDTGRMLGINKNTVIGTLKKANPIVNTLAASGGMEIEFGVDIHAKLQV
ncbi:MAG: hypothetical protein ISR72_01945 [Methylobacter sp.]|nr:hypothetical protein [Methylobacter sp.]